MKKEYLKMYMYVHKNELVYFHAKTTHVYILYSNYVIQMLFVHDKHLNDIKILYQWSKSNTVHVHVQWCLYIMDAYG